MSAGSPGLTDSPSQTDRQPATSLLGRFRFLQTREDQVFLALSLIIGALTGCTVVAFILLTERVGMRLYPPGSAAWRRISFPVMGALAMGYLLYRYFPNARGSGVPQTKAALYARDGRILLKTVFGKFFCTSATLGCGIPLGREGPSVQVGAGIGSVLGRFLGLPTERIKQLLPVGASAAIAAAFNTPLAAVVFALEEVVGDLHAPMIGPVVLASATSWLVLRILLGDNPLFKVPHYELVHASEFLIYAVLGVAGGLTSALFSKLLLSMRAAFLKFPKKTLPFQPVAGGLLVGLLGLLVPQVLGVGYGYVGQALNGHMALNLMLLLVFLKLIAVTMSYASGNAGGIFGPALFIGSMLGGSLGTVAHNLFPAHTAGSGAYALVGMGAAFAGIVRAPMTSVLMIFEMTQDYAVIVPLMISNLVSLFISSRLQREPIYEALAVQDGIHLPASKSQRDPQHQVLFIMRTPVETLPADITVADAIDKVRAGKFPSAVVTDGARVVGVFNLDALQKELPNKGRKVIDLLDTTYFPHVHSDQSLDVALERMGSNHVQVLPVVSRADIHELLGIVTLGDVLESYGLGLSENR